MGINKNNHYKWHSRNQSAVYGVHLGTQSQTIMEMLGTRQVGIRRGNTYSPGLSLNVRMDKTKLLFNKRICYLNTLLCLIEKKKEKKKNAEVGSFSMGKNNNFTNNMQPKFQLQYPYWWKNCNLREMRAISLNNTWLFITTVGTLQSNSISFEI